VGLPNRQWVRRRDAVGQRTAQLYKSGTGLGGEQRNHGEDTQVRNNLLDGEKEGKTRGPRNDTLEEGSQEKDQSKKDQQRNPWVNGNLKEKTKQVVTIPKKERTKGHVQGRKLPAPLGKGKLKKKKKKKEREPKCGGSGGI